MNLTREQFIELSAKVFTAENWKTNTIEFEGNLMMLETAYALLENYRNSNLEITSTGQIPDNIANQNLGR